MATPGVSGFRLAGIVAFALPMLYPNNAAMDSQGA
jgi:hypothetical protein